MTNTNQNQFGADLLAQYLELYGYVPPNAYGVPQAPVLSQNPTMMGQGVLSGAAPYMTLNPVAGSQNRRSAAPINVPPPPQRQIGMNETLMRVGGDMVGASQKGGLAAIEAGTDAYGNIQDYNRARELEDYNSAVLAKLRSAQAQKALTGGKKTGTGTNVTKQASADIVNDAGARALEIVEKDIVDKGFLNNYFTGATGWAGLLTKNMPGSNAKVLGNLILTIQGNAGFDKLQAMREASPTGGALGQVSNFELQQLNAAFGNLDQSTRPEELRYNLINLIHVYNNIIHGPGNHPFPPANELNLDGGGAQQPQQNSSLDDADAIVGIK